MSAASLPGDNLSGYRVAVCQSLAGGKRAIEQNGTLYVSPAMWALLDGAGDDQDELKRLLQSIEVLHLPRLDLGNVFS